MISICHLGVTNLHLHIYRPGAARKAMLLEDQEGFFYDDMILPVS